MAALSRFSPGLPQVAVDDRDSIREYVSRTAEEMKGRQRNVIRAILSKAL
jgi:hypothetical protein